MLDFTQLNVNDNVVVALMDLSAGQSVSVQGEIIKLKEDVNRGHKLAIKEISKGENVVKYGYPIGHAIKAISVGEHVHTQNTKTNLDGIQEYQFNQKLNNILYQNENLSFQGYKRKNGNVGIRNELWIVPTVGCVNGVAERIIKRFEKEVGDISPFENILVLKHNYGCSQLGDDHENTKKILLDAVQHPNAGGVLVLGLGCENNNLYEFKKSLGAYDENRVKFLVSQEVSDEIGAGVQLLKEIYEDAKSDKREPAPLSELKIGLKCGGSDGFSGITANPLLGRFSDFLVAQGGTTVLTEVPEMFGEKQS
jgi:altronate hydrolase